MKNGVHFISGLPRSGSTLLSCLLRQNPRFSAGMTSPVGTLFNAMLTATSQRSEASIFLEDTHRERLLRACFEAYYADIHPYKVVFDTNRQWTAKLPALTRMFPKAKVICCVRELGWVINSIESLAQRNAFELSGIFGFEAQTTVYSRAEMVSKPDGLVGYSLNALREAVYGPFADRLLLVRYETLTANPIVVLSEIYDFIGEPIFAHDPQNIEPAYDMVEFDQRLGTPGLHAVGRSVRAASRESIVPPDLFLGYRDNAFWNDPHRLPSHVRVV